MRNGRIGVFDSGLGGLLVFKHLAKELPEYDYIYLGDTKRVPYGNRSERTIYQFLKEATDFLFGQGCELIIVACNTVSAVALRKLQQEYLPVRYPGKKVLGVIIPAAELCESAKRIGILATQATVGSKTFVREIKKVTPKAKVFQKAAPLLVPLIEEGKHRETIPFLQEYLKPLLKGGIDTLVLGCTHYGNVKKEVRELIGPDIRIVSQNDILPDKLRTYLANHPEIEKRLSKKRKRQLLVTDATEYYRALARKWFGKSAVLHIVDLSEPRKVTG